MVYKIIKSLRSKNYNYDFNTNNGFFKRWGKNIKDDPDWSEYGPEILDIEISTKCSKGCKWCYKTNTNNGQNMSLETFTQLINKFPKTLTQIAFGIGDINANKDLYEIMKECRKREIIPNITINGALMNETQYNELTKLCGAVAVSYYDDDECFNAVNELTNRGATQINIHCLLSNETFDKCMSLIDKTKTDERLKKLNAVVFLWLKPKGKRNNLTQLDDINKMKKLVNKAFSKGVSIGFDSCSAPIFMQCIQEHLEKKLIEQMIEPCESTCFSYYINVQGIGYPCSFSEGLEEFNGVDITKVKNFSEVWNHEETKKFRNKLLNNKDCNKCRQCQIYSLGCKE